MIPANAKLSIQRIPLACLQVVEAGKPWTCFPEKFAIYLDLLTKFPDEDTDPLIVAPSPTHKGMYTITNGKHRFCASILTGRSDVLAVVVEDA